MDDLLEYFNNLLEDLLIFYKVTHLLEGFTQVLEGFTHN